MIHELEQQNLPAAEPKNHNRSLYIGNTHIKVTENDIYDFLDFANKYLCETSKKVTLKDASF